MTTLPKTVTGGGTLEPSELIAYVDAVAVTLGTSSRVSYNEACWLASEADRKGAANKDLKDRRVIEESALRKLELGLAAGPDIKSWARTDPSLKPLRESPNMDTRNDFQQLAGTEDPAAGDLSAFQSIGTAWSKQLAALKVTTQSALRKRIANADGRAELAGGLDAPVDLMSVWYEALALAEVVGTAATANLLAQAGINTVAGLAAATAEVVARRLAILNVSPKVLLHDPDKDDVATWILAAKVRIKKTPKPT